MPDDGAQPFRVRGHSLPVERRDDDALVGNSRRVATVPADDAEDPGTCAPRVIESADEIRGDVPLRVAASDREHENHVARAEPRAGEPSGEDTFPAVVVDPGG